MSSCMPAAESLLVRVRRTIQCHLFANPISKAVAASRELMRWQLLGWAQQSRHSTRDVAPNQWKSAAGLRLRRQQLGLRSQVPLWRANERQTAAPGSECAFLLARALIKANANREIALRRELQSLNRGADTNIDGRPHGERIGDALDRVSAQRKPRWLRCNVNDDDFVSKRAQVERDGMRTLLRWSVRANQHRRCYERK